jgi:hypothetical protein
MYSWSLSSSIYSTLGNANSYFFWKCFQNILFMHNNRIKDKRGKIHGNSLLISN